MTSSPASATLRPLDPVAAARLRDRLAAHDAPWLHQECARRLAERVAVFRRAPARVIDWSGPGGAPATVLAQACAQARIDRVGATTPAAPQRWWQRLRPAGAALLAPEAVAEQAYDLGWSVMALHWASDPAQTLRNWRRALSPDGALLFSTLGPATLAGLRELYAQAGWGSPMAPLVDMHDLGDMLVEAGFDGPVMDQETLTLTWTSPQAALHELRSLGANLDPQRFAGCRTPRWHARLLDALAARRGPDGRVALSFELVYGHAIRGADRGPRVTPDTRISLGEMSALLRRPPR